MVQEPKIITHNNNHNEREHSHGAAKNKPQNKGRPTNINTKPDTSNPGFFNIPSSGSGVNHKVVPKTQKNEPAISSAITPATGAKRITDRFVRYPYPPNVASIYQKEIARVKRDQNAPPPKHKDAFNLEKEPKQQVKHKFTGNSSFLMDFTKPPHKAGRSEQPQSSEYNSKVAVK